VLTADVQYLLFPWNRYSLSGSWAHERADQPGNYYTIGLKSWFNF